MLLLAPAPAIEKLTVATTQWHPYSYEESGVQRGISTEFVKKIIKDSGYTYEIQQYPWARSYQKAVNEKNTLLYSIVRTPERENHFHWIGQVAPPIRSYLVKLKSNNQISTNQLIQLSQYKIGVTRDGVDQHILTDAGFRNLIPNTHRGLSVQQLIVGRVDMVVLTEEELMKAKVYDVNVEQLEKVTLLNENGVYLAMSKKSDVALVERLTSSYKRLKLEGEIKF